jgi:hypothetical protein
MARAVRGLVYGDNINYKSPTVDSVVFDGNTATITFKDIGLGLDTTQTLAEFTLLEGGTSATTTTATFLGNDKIVVTGTGITSADEVRYSWSQLPTTTVWGVQSDGVKLPASPFRFIGGVQ